MAAIILLRCRRLNWLCVLWVCRWFCLCAINGIKIAANTMLSQQKISSKTEIMSLAVARALAPPPALYLIKTISRAHHSVGISRMLNAWCAVCAYLWLKCQTISATINHPAFQWCELPNECYMHECVRVAVRRAKNKTKREKINNKKA